MNNGQELKHWMLMHCNPSYEARQELRVSLDGFLTYLDTVSEHAERKRSLGAEHVVQRGGGLGFSS